MRALAFVLLLVGTSLTGTGETLDRAIQALMQVESNCSSSEIGDNGKAYGILQIHNVMIQDYNRITQGRPTALRCIQSTDIKHRVPHGSQALLAGHQVAYTQAHCIHLERRRRGTAPSAAPSQ